MTKVTTFKFKSCILCFKLKVEKDLTSPKHSRGIKKMSRDL